MKIHWELEGIEVIHAGDEREDLDVARRVQEMVVFADGLKRIFPISSSLSSIFRRIEC